MTKYAWLAVLMACGSTPQEPVAPVDAGRQLVEVVPFTENAAERIAVDCREIVGAQFVSNDSTHLRARADGVILRSRDEGRSWTRAPVDTGPAAATRFVGPVMLAFANVDPQTADAGFRVSADRGDTWHEANFRPLDDASLPPGTVVTNAGTARLAWTPSNALFVSLANGPWLSEPNAALETPSDDLHATLGSREWLQQNADQSLYRTNDSGRTWQRLPFQRFSAIELSAGGRVVAAGEGLWFSEDDGATWTRRPGLSRDFAVGPGDDEVWAMSEGTAPRLMHSIDFGRSFAPVTLAMGSTNASVTELAVHRVNALDDGRKVFAPRIGPDFVVCIESRGAGSFDRASPMQNDTPGTATLWARGSYGFALGTLQQVVPQRTPGSAFGLTSRTFPDGIGVRGGTRLPSGEIAVLLQPREVIDLNAGPPMQVQVLDGTSLSPTRMIRFTNLLRTSTGRETKYLESKWLQALPDGGLRTDTAEGDFPIGVDSAVWVPWPSNGRWGRGGQFVTFDLIGATRFFRASSDLNEASIHCVAGGPTERCLRTTGNVQDFAVRDGRLYVLDAWRGEVLEGVFANRDDVLRPILTGLAKPTSLFVPVDDDLGVYVVDTNLYRVVPGASAARRP